MCAHTHAITLEQLYTLAESFMSLKQEFNSSNFPSICFSLILSFPFLHPSTLVHLLHPSFIHLFSVPSIRLSFSYWFCFSVVIPPPTLYPYFPPSILLVLSARLCFPASLCPVCTLSVSLIPLSSFLMHLIQTFSRSSSFHPCGAPRGRFLLRFCS